MLIKRGCKSDWAARLRPARRGACAPGELAPQRLGPPRVREGRGGRRGVAPVLPAAIGVPGHFGTATDPSVAGQEGRPQRSYRQQLANTSTTTAVSNAARRRRGPLRAKVGERLHAAATSSGTDSASATVHRLGNRPPSLRRRPSRRPRTQRPPPTRRRPPASPGPHHRGGARVTQRPRDLQ